jgi:hypothetical protein
MAPLVKLLTEEIRLGNEEYFGALQFTQIKALRFRLGLR